MTILWIEKKKICWLIIVIKGRENITTIIAANSMKFLALRVANVFIFQRCAGPSVGSSTLEFGILLPALSNGVRRAFGALKWVRSYSEFRCTRELRHITDTGYTSKGWVAVQARQVDNKIIHFWGGKKIFKRIVNTMNCKPSNICMSFQSLPMYAM